MSTDDDKLLFQPTRLASYDDKSLISEIQRVVKEQFNGNCPTSSEFNRHSRVAASTLSKRFGSWADAMRAAGFQYKRSPISLSELKADLERVFGLHNQTYFTNDFYVENGKYSPKTLKKRFGCHSWEGLLESVLSLRKEQKVYKEIKPKPAPPAKDELLAELKRVWDQLGRRPSYGEFKELGKFTVKRYETQFGTWTNTVQSFCDIYGYQIQGGNGFNSTPEILLAELKKIAEKIESPTFQFAQYKKLGGTYSIGTFQKTFGSWRKAVEGIGLKAGRGPDYSNEVLFDEVQRLWESLGRQPKAREVKKLTKLSFATFVKRFGSWTKTVYEFCIDRGTISEAEPASDNSEERSEVISEIAQAAEQSIKDESILKANDVTELDGAENTIRMTTPRIPSKRLRFIVLNRDGFTCVKCGRSPENTPGLILHIDHIMPYSRGGETVEDNLQTLCADCNIGKSDLVI